jgi:cytochrome c-type biogenesis protein CcmH/NrfG
LNRALSPGSRAIEKQYAEAIAEYRTTLCWNPRLAPLLFSLGTALLENGKIDEAITTLQKANSLAPNSPEIGAALAQALRWHSPAH